MNKAESLTEQVQMNLKEEDPHSESPRKQVCICHFLFSQQFFRDVEGADAQGRNREALSAWLNHFLTQRTDSGDSLRSV